MTTVGTSHASNQIILGETSKNPHATDVARLDAGLSVAISTMTHDSIDAAWRAAAPALAAKMRMLYVSRTDRHGAYRGTRTDGGAVATATLTYPPGGSKPDALSDHVLTSHFAAAGQYRQVERSAVMRDGVTSTTERGISATVGVHLVSPTNACKFVRVDLDAHGKDATAETAAVNHRAATAWCERLRSVGLTPVMYDSDRRGGLWVDVHFAEAIPSETAYALGKWIVRDWRVGGLSSEPESFPKQSNLDGLKYGHWVRLPGMHPKRGVWSRVWDFAGGRWLAGQAAVDAILVITANDPTGIPAEVAFAAEVIAGQDAARTAEPLAAPVAIPTHAADDHGKKLYRAARFAEAVGCSAEGGRNNTAYKVAAFCFGNLSLTFADTLIVLAAWNTGNAPPLSADELEAVAGSAQTSNRGFGDVARPWRDRADASSLGDELPTTDLSDMEGPPHIDPAEGAVLGGTSAPITSCVPKCGSGTDSQGCTCHVECRASTLSYYPPNTPIGECGRAGSVLTPDEVRSIVGPPPPQRACRHPTFKVREGQTGKIDTLRLSCGKCLPCQWRRRFAEKMTHVRVAYAIATHAWTGTDAEFAAVRKRIARLRKKYGLTGTTPTYRVTASPGVRTVFLGIDLPQADLPADIGLMPLTSAEAARKLCRAIDDIPYVLPKNTWWVSESKSWKNARVAILPAGAISDGDPPAHAWTDLGRLPASHYDFQALAEIAEQHEAEVQHSSLPSIRVEERLIVTPRPDTDSKVFFAMFGVSLNSMRDAARKRREDAAARREDRAYQRAMWKEVDRMSRDLQKDYRANPGPHRGYLHDLFGCGQTAA